MRDKVISKTMLGLLAASTIITAPMATGTVYATDTNTDTAVTSNENSITATDAESYIITVYDEYYDADGQLEHRDTRTQDSLEQGSEYYYEALDTPGYAVQGDSVKSGTATKDEDITFAYVNNTPTEEPADEPSVEPADGSTDEPTDEPSVEPAKETTTKKPEKKNAPKSTTKKSSSETKAKAPKTGDFSLIASSGLFSAGAGMAATALAKMKKKKRH